jgi:uncharacterized cupin superfamily protein
MHRRKMKRMENGAWRLALGGAKMLAWRTSDRASSEGVMVKMYKCTEGKWKEWKSELGAWRLAA